MTRTELKKLVKELLTEVLSEDFIKKTINESIADKINISVQIPGMSATTTSQSEAQIMRQPKKQQITEEMRNKMRRAVLGEDENVVLAPTNPKITAAVEKIQDPIFKEMAKETIQREAAKTEQQLSFSDAEKSFIDFNKISALTEAIEK
jgi:hypothetical protein